MGRDAFEVLSERQCRLLLGQEHVGRVAVSEEALTAVFPVNYTVVSDEILFFSGKGTKLRAATANARVTFEVDHLDPVAETGWSVMVVGMVREVTEPAVVAEARAAGLRPWADGERPHLVALTTEVVSGRRAGSGRAKTAAKGEFDGIKAIRPRQGVIGGIESKREDDLDLDGMSLVESTEPTAYMRTDAGACTIWRPVGDLDAFSVTRFRKAFAAMASAPQLVIDLADVAFVDSAGVGALIGGIRRVRELGGEVAVACPRTGLNRVLHTAGLDRLVTVVSSVDEAAVVLEVRRPTGPVRPTDQANLRKRY